VFRALPCASSPHPSHGSPHPRHGQPQGQMRTPPSTHAHTHAHLFSCRSSAPADGHLGVRARGAGRESQGKAPRAPGASRGPARASSARAWAGDRASCEEWPARGTVSEVIHPQEVSLAKVTGNHLKVAGGKLSKSLVYGSPSSRQRAAPRKHQPASAAFSASTCSSWIKWM